MPAIRPPSPSEASAYATRLQKVVRVFDRLGHGSRQRASFDLRIPPSRLSGVLNGRELNDTILTQLEEWVESQATPA